MVQESFNRVNKTPARRYKEKSRHPKGFESLGNSQVSLPTGNEIIVGTQATSRIYTPRDCSEDVPDLW